MSGARHKTLKRFERPEHARFLTFSCYHRLPLFTNDRIKDAFVDALIGVKYTAGFRLYAWVIMPEHVHLLLQTGSDKRTVETIFRRLKTPFAQQTIKRWRELDAPILSRLQDAAGRTRFWQPGGGYDRNIFTADEFQEKIRYIHHNPIKRGLTKKAVEYPWSSAQWYAGNHDHQLEIDPIK